MFKSPHLWYSVKSAPANECIFDQGWSFREGNSCVCYTNHTPGSWVTETLVGEGTHL